MRLTLFALAALSTGLTVQAQMQDNQDRQLNCDRQNQSRNGRNVSYCEMKEQSLPATGRITVDGGTNGGVSVKGWLRNEVLVRSQIQANAPTLEEARGMAGQVHVSA